MNERIRGVFTLILTVFGALMVFTTVWQIVEAPRLTSKAYNRQTAHFEQRIKRGLVTDRYGKVLARNRVERDRAGEPLYHRAYPYGELTAHVVGYSTSGKSRTGLERRFNAALTASTRSLASIADRLRGYTAIQGDTVETTLSMRATRIAVEKLAGRQGSIVAIEPKTGAIRVMVSSPSFDPNAVENRFSSIPKENSPLVNRATQARYVPGSVFKLITAAAAIEAGIANPTTQFPGGCVYKDAAGPPIYNHSKSCFGRHDLTAALTNSINTTFAQLGDELGQARLRATMKRFGFDGRNPIDDLPDAEVLPSGLLDVRGRQLPADTSVDSARVAIGQERLGVTPLQIADVVATIARGGKRVRPYLVQEIRQPDGSVTFRAKVDKMGRAMTAAAAFQLTGMMRNVVKEGTGTAGALSGIEVAGKTGTADTSSGNQVWFVAFAPADNPTIAIAVTLEDQAPGTSGGAVAAPVARDVLQELLR